MALTKAGLLVLLALSCTVFTAQEVQAGRYGNPFGRRPLQVVGKAPIQTSRPYNIAHRGDNGQLPEETAEAYQRAIDVGADFIETDILSTKDGVLICMHDVTLEATTNIVNHTEFANRTATYEVEGANMTGIFTVDLTLAEIKTLGATQRMPQRDHSYDGLYQIITFEEYLQIALNASRIVGVYPEIKDPVFINKHVTWPGGKRFEDIFIETLFKYGYTGTYLSPQWMAQPVFIQSFAPTSLVYVANLTNSPKVFLIDDTTVTTQDTNQTYQEITSDAYLDYISNFVVGIGPWKDTIVPPLPDNYLGAPTDLVTRAHARKLQVHPYTFRNENQYLHFNFVEDAYQEYTYWLKYMGVDGLFTDFTQSLFMYQNWDMPLKKHKH